MNKITVVLLLFCQLVLGQKFYKVEGVIVDSETQQGISNVHISMVDDGLGTISNTDGKFIIKSQKPIRALYFSHIGYEIILLDYGKNK